MSTVPNSQHEIVAVPLTQRPSDRVPPLCNGDHLHADEFWRRYSAMPEFSHAELIKGVVYLMASPVTAERHGEPHALLITWLGVYAAQTAGVRVGDNSTLRLDDENTPQADAYLRKIPGQSKIVDKYLEGAPEFVAEVAATSAAYDLYEKLDAYRQNNVREYLVVRTFDRAVDWFVLRDGQYVRLAAVDGIYRSEQFPGLWFDAAAYFAEDAAKLLQTLQTGLATRSG